MPRKVIDLSMPCSNETDGIKVTPRGDVPVYLGCECYGYDLEIKSHKGTYFETSSHVFRDGKDTDEVPLDELILPGLCLRISGDHRCITASDLEAASKSVNLLPASALLIDVGHCNDDNFKYFSRDAAQWMAKRKVAIMGSNTLKYDSGFENPTGFFIDLFKAQIPIIANIKNLDQLPPDGFTLITLPLKITGICTVPCRVVAVCGEV